MAAYSWTEHIQAVCRLLGRNGVNYAPALYATDVHGNCLMSGLDPAAVKFSMTGACSRVVYESFGFPGLTHQEKLDLMPKVIKRVEIMLNLFFKAGLSRVPRSHPTISLVKLDEVGEWAPIEKLLRDAYKIAKEAGR